MTSKGSKQRGDQPVVPQVTPGAWKELLAAAEEVRRLAPWKWMHDSQVVGLRHPVTNEVLLGSVLGRLGEVFAIIVYRNDAGRRWLLETILNDGPGPDGDEAGFMQDAIKVEFVAKSELEKEDRAVLATAGFAPSAKVGHVWPQVRSFTPGGYPWHVTQGEAETLAWAVPRVAAVARLLRAQPDLWDGHCDGEIAFLAGDFDPTRGELAAEKIDWQPMIPPPEPAPTEVSLDETAIAELLRLKKAPGFQLEVDVAHSFAVVVADVERPRMPKLALAVEHKSGYVAGVQLSGKNDPDGAAALGEVLHKALAQVKARPEVILVQRRRVGAMLKRLAEKLEIPVVSEAKLDALNFARASLEEFGGR